MALALRCLGVQAGMMMPCRTWTSPVTPQPYLPSKSLLAQADAGNFYCCGAVQMPINRSEQWNLDKPWIGSSTAGWPRW